MDFLLLLAAITLLCVVMAAMTAKMAIESRDEFHERICEVVLWCCSGVYALLAGMAIAKAVML